MASSLDWCGKAYLDEGMKCFTSYFGTKLHGAEITWANNPNGKGVEGVDGVKAGGSLVDKNELKIIYKQILTSRLYTWYSSAMTEDRFRGTWDMNTAIPVQSGSGTVVVATNKYSIDQVSAKVPQDAAPSDIVFHMQLKNPVSNDLPAYDGFYALA